MAAACIRIDERTRAEARRARREWDWGAERRSAAFLLPSLAERALRAAGYRPAPQGAWVGPDGEHFEDLELAVLTEFTAAALAEAEPSPDPIEEVLRQIREVAMIPVGQVLLSPEDRIRALTAKLERIANIAADGEPDEDWRPSLIDEASS